MANDFVYILKVGILIMAVGSLATIQNSLRQDKINSFEYTLLILFSILGILLLVCSSNMLALYLALELQSLVL